jgi:hypothetical protein
MLKIALVWHNKGMGCFSDDPALLIKAAEFLQARTKEQAPARRNY